MTIFCSLYFGLELSRPENLQNSIVIAPECKVLLGDINGKTTVKCKDAYYDKNGNVVEGGDRALCVFYNGERIISFIGCPPQKYINQQGGANKFIELIINKYEESH